MEGGVYLLELKNNLRHLRRSKDYTQKELGLLVGSTQTTIWAIESGQCIPTVKLALLLSVALNCKVEDIFYFVDSDYS